MASYSANDTPLSGRTARISPLICSRDSSRSLRRMLDAYLDRSCRASLQSLPSKTPRPVPDAPCPHRRGLDLCMHTPVRRPGRCCAVSQQLPNPSLGHHLTANTYKSDGRRRSLWATAQKARQIRRNLFSKRLYDALVGIPMHIITLLVVSVLVGWLSTLILLSDLDNLSARFRHWRNGRSVGRRAVGSSPCGISTARSTAWCCQERSYRGSAP
jgi:hypothetical protein